MPISRDCDGCTEIHRCQVRYKRVRILDVVYCPSGERHLVDQ